MIEETNSIKPKPPRLGRSIRVSVHCQPQTRNTEKKKQATNETSFVIGDRRKIEAKKNPKHFIFIFWGVLSKPHKNLFEGIFRAIRTQKKRKDQRQIAPPPATGPAPSVPIWWTTPPEPRRHPKREFFFNLKKKDPRNSPSGGGPKRSIEDDLYRFFSLGLFPFVGWKVETTFFTPIFFSEGNKKNRRRKKSSKSMGNVFAPKLFRFGFLFFCLISFFFFLGSYRPRPPISPR